MPARRRRAAAMGLLVACVLAACSNGGSAAPKGPVVVVVHDQQPGSPFDRRLLGTNLPAWVGGARLADPAFRTAVVESGATVVRLPGGSWSNDYDWLGCENGTPACAWDFAARPSDFLGFLQATGLAAMWTVNVNETAQQAASLVAFFNGRIDDTRSIGTDRNGVDWRTVGDWARLRSSHGHPDPQPIATWEIGNEIFGGKPNAEDDCASFGWETSWTCDGAKYASGTDAHDGYLAISAAMKAVDPTIAIGAVGVADGSAWGGWGDEVLRGAGGSLDFYVLHQYAFSNATNTAGALTNPPTTWSKLMEQVQHSFTAQLDGRRVPVAVTEYNLTAIQDGDDDRLMTKAVNALFIADTIGQMAEHGVAMANQWNVINGAASNGTDYGMVNDAGVRAPQYFALALWSHFGTTTVPVTASDTAADRQSTYASTDADGTVTVVLINKTALRRQVDVAADGFTGPASVATATVAATGLDATDVTWNGVPGAAVAAAPPMEDLGSVAMPLDRDLPPYSITLLRITRAAA